VTPSAPPNLFTTSVAEIIGPAEPTKSVLAGCDIRNDTGIDQLVGKNAISIETFIDEATFRQNRDSPLPIRRSHRAERQRLGRVRESIVFQRIDLLTQNDRIEFGLRSRRDIALTASS